MDSPSDDFTETNIQIILADPEEAIDLDAHQQPSEEDVERMMLEPEFSHKLHEEL